MTLKKLYKKILNKILGRVEFDTITSHAEKQKNRMDKFITQCDNDIKKIAVKQQKLKAKASGKTVDANMTKFMRDKLAEIYPSRDEFAGEEHF